MTNGSTRWSSRCAIPRRRRLAVVAQDCAKRHPDHRSPRYAPSSATGHPAWRVMTAVQGEGRTPARSATRGPWYWRVLLGILAQRPGRSVRGLAEDDGAGPDFYLACV